MVFCSLSLVMSIRLRYFAHFCSASFRVLSKSQCGISAAKFSRAFCSETGERATLSDNCSFLGTSKMTSTTFSCQLAWAIVLFVKVLILAFDSKLKDRFRDFAQPVVVQVPEMVLASIFCISPCKI